MPNLIPPLLHDQSPDTNSPKISEPKNPFLSEEFRDHCHSIVIQQRNEFIDKYRQALLAAASKRRKEGEDLAAAMDRVFTFPKPDEMTRETEDELYSDLCHVQLYLFCLV